MLQIGENDPGLAILLVHLNANMKSIFNDPKSMFVHTSVKEYLFDGVRFCINPQGLAKAICNQIKDGGSKTIRELKDGSLAFSFFNHVSFELYPKMKSVHKFPLDIFPEKRHGS